ncbi:DUF397 domain-containing protein [Streptomyces lydicus]|uniref:DUF397 domain-containing protein n=1 Tax=Streptomyces lydicus TaxID=47763 RepID=UPI003790F70D
MEPWESGGPGESWPKSTRRNGASRTVVYTETRVGGRMYDSTPGGPALVFPAGNWTAFVSAVKSGDLSA